MDSNYSMKCVNRCVGIETQICNADTNICVGPELISIATMIISSFAAFFSLIWCFVADGILCELSTYQAGFLAIGGSGMFAVCLISANPGPISSLENYEKLRYSTAGATIFYVMLLCAFICNKLFCRK